MPVEIRKGDCRDIDDVLKLLHEVQEAMENREWFFLDPDEEFREMMLEGNMELWVAVDGEQVVGAFDCLRPGLRENNYGYDLGFSDEELLRVFNMDTAAVHPDYRGRKLQKRLVEAAEAELQKYPGAILLCTVHPDNRFSLDNVQAMGYQIVKVKEKYGSVRCILRKDIV